MKKWIHCSLLFVVVMISSISNVNAQDLLQTYQYLSPSPNSQFAAPGTTITIRYGAPIADDSINDWNFTVTGSESGVHRGEAVLARDQKTVIFKPIEPFKPGEHVSVYIQPVDNVLSGKRFAEVSYTFTTAGAAPTSTTSLALEGMANTVDLTSNSVPAAQNNALASPYVTAPAELPSIQVLTPAGDVADGYIFTSYFHPSVFQGDVPNSNTFILILDNNGEPIYYRHLPEFAYGADLKVLSNGLLAYWEGRKIHLVDNQYQPVRTISAGNGYELSGIDVHEITLTPEGNYLYQIYYGLQMDLTAHGGKPDANVIDIILQEQDPDGNIVFQWVGLEHYQLTDTIMNLTAQNVDYAHGNAIAVDTDGNLLLSVRHMNEITKIDRKGDGSIIWRFGGKNNDFTVTADSEITEDPTFFLQHDIRVLPEGGPGDISIYDNHNNAYSLDTMSSRAQVFNLDETNRTAQMVWQYQNTPGVYANFMGNAQYLPNGNFMVGWGGVPSPSITEVKADGTKVFEFGFTDSFLTYRAYRFPWHGFPTWDPTLALVTAGEAAQLFMSWNGATEIARYEIYGWGVEHPRTLITEASKAGFETSVDLTGEQANYCYYQVMPIDKEGAETHLSNFVQNPACNLRYLPVIGNQAVLNDD